MMDERGICYSMQLPSLFVFICAVEGNTLVIENTYISLVSAYMVNRFNRIV